MVRTIVPSKERKICTGSPKLESCSSLYSLSDVVQSFCLTTLKNVNFLNIDNGVMSTCFRCDYIDSHSGHRFEFDNLSYVSGG